LPPRATRGGARQRRCRACAGHGSMTWNASGPPLPTVGGRVQARRQATRPHLTFDLCNGRPWCRLVRAYAARRPRWLTGCGFHIQRSSGVFVLNQIPDGSCDGKQITTAGAVHTSQISPRRRRSPRTARPVPSRLRSESR
jgi:hypothetical protein